MKKKTKALVLYSGGLDSRLVIMLLKLQKLKVAALYFKLPFACSCFKHSDKEFLKKNSVKLKVMDCTKPPLFEEYMKIIKNPKYGHGKGLNPCIDCKIFMFKKAGDYADKKKIPIIATGEVLGERPMSQTSRALAIIDKNLNFELLRPLSAKLLKETQAEKIKLIDRKKFHSIQGRKRLIQIDLAKKFNMNFPNPAGGCLLCDKNYSKKLKDLLLEKDRIEKCEIESIKGFRYFRNNGRIILGRNYKENKKLERINKRLKFNILIPQFAGPTGLYESEKDKALVCKLIKAYSSKNIKQREKYSKYKVG